MPAQGGIPQLLCSCGNKLRDLLALLALQGSRRHRGSACGGSTRAGWKHHMETGSASSRKATEMTQNLFQTFVSRGRELAMSAELNQIQTSDLVAEDLT